MSASFGKRLSLDHKHILNEGAALRNSSVDDDEEEEDDFDGAPLAPRYAQESSFIEPKESSFLTSSERARVSATDQHLEKTLTSIKSMSLMFESGALQLPASTRPPSFPSIPATNSSSRVIVVPEAPPPRNSSSAQRALVHQSPANHSLSRREQHQSRSPDDASPSDATKSYVRDLEHRVEQLEAMLKAMQQRLETVVASQESTKIPSKHDRAPDRAIPAAHTNNPPQAQQAFVDGKRLDDSPAIETVHHGPATDRSVTSNPNSGRRLSLQSAAQGIIFARRLHLPAIGQLPTFDPAACSKGILLHSMKQAATLMQFSNTPHPYCLGPVITRGSSILSISLYIGEPAIPAISSSNFSVDLQSVLKTGSVDDIVEAVISSQHDDLSQALKSFDHSALVNLSKKLGVTIRVDKHFEVRCEVLRKRCNEIVRDAANGGVCFFGVCGANAPSHGIRGDEMVWCSSMNQRKDPGAPKAQPLVTIDDRMAGLDTHIELLVSDLKTICDRLGPEFCGHVNRFINHRRPLGIEESYLADEKLNPFNDVGPKQVRLISELFIDLMRFISVV